MSHKIDFLLSTSRGYPSAFWLEYRVGIHFNRKTRIDKLEEWLNDTNFGWSYDRPLEKAYALSSEIPEDVYSLIFEDEMECKWFRLAHDL